MQTSMCHLVCVFEVDSGTCYEFANVLEDRDRDLSLLDEANVKGMATATKKLSKFACGEFLHCCIVRQATKDEVC